WVAVFLKFQTQAWHSDDTGGVPNLPPDPDFPDDPHTPVDPNKIPPTDVPDGLVRIIAAYVNDIRTPERETVTLLNTSDQAISLEGWQIKDKQKKAMPLSGTIAPGATTVIVVRDPVTLSNKGGIITLLNADGVKVHGVAY